VRKRASNSQDQADKQPHNDDEKQKPRIMREVGTLSAKNVAQSCVLVIMTNGFDETETISIISILRQAGLCVKSVGLASGLVGSAHGLWLMPDLTLSDLDDLVKTKFVRMVVLPENEQSLARLEIDPRIHKFLSQVVAQKGQIAVGPRGMQLLKAASTQGNRLDNEKLDYASCLLIQKPGQSPEVFAHDLVRRLTQSPRSGNL